MNTADDPQRRRAQNRASQRAFRSRKEKRMKEIEEGWIDLQGRHSELTKKYEKLQQDHSDLKHELETLLSKNDKISLASRNQISHTTPWDMPRTDLFDLLFDVSAFCYNPESRAQETMT